MTHANLASLPGGLMALCGAAGRSDHSGIAIAPNKAASPAHSAVAQRLQAVHARHSLDRATPMLVRKSRFLSTEACAGVSSSA